MAASVSFSQTVTDSTTYIISSGGASNTLSPLSLSEKPFYDFLRPNKQGLRPTAFYSRDDRVFVGLNYNAFSDHWKSDSIGQKHRLYTHYSIQQKAFSFGYQGIYNRLVGHWNLFADVNYDWVKWMNFYGLGNETVQQVDDADFYRVRSKEALVRLAFQHKIGKQSSVLLTPSFRHVELLRDDGRFLTTQTFEKNNAGIYQASNFGGLRADLLLQRLNDLLVPTKGIVFIAGAEHVRNMAKPKAFTNFNIYNRIFLPFLQHFVFSVEAGAATQTGEPEFYQMNSIGGNTLRGYRRERFRGETIFHNNNELQYIFDVDNRLLKGKMGFLAFVDQGRVWKKGETSDTWHHGYGGGIILVPYHKIYLSAQYGISKERRAFHFELRRSL